MQKVAKFGLCLLIGVVGAEITSSVILMSLGVPAPSAFGLASWSARLTDPIAWVFAAAFFSFGWVCISRIRAFTAPRHRIQATHGFRSGPDRSVADRQNARRA
jgi:hypothetical protein